MTVITASPTLSYEFGDSFGFEVYVPFENETLESNDNGNDSHSQSCSPVSYHDNNFMKNGDNGCGHRSDGGDKRRGLKTVCYNNDNDNDDKYKYCPHSPDAESQEMKNRRLELHRAEKGRKCSIVSDEGRKSSQVSVSSINIDTDEGDDNDEDNTESYDKSKSVFSVFHDKNKGERGEREGENNNDNNNENENEESVHDEIKNCFTSNLKRMGGRNKDRGLRGRERGRERGGERGRERRVEGQRHLCSASGSRVHSDDEGEEEEREEGEGEEGEGKNEEGEGGGEGGRVEYDYNIERNHNIDESDNEIRHNNENNNINDDNNGDNDDIQYEDSLSPIIRISGSSSRRSSGSGNRSRSGSGQYYYTGSGEKTKLKSPGTHLIFYDSLTGFISCHCYTFYHSDHNNSLKIKHNLLLMTEIASHRILFFSTGLKRIEHDCNELN